MRTNSATAFTNTRQLRVDDVEARLGGTIQVTLEVLTGAARGRMFISSAFGVTATGNNTARLVLRGTLANINRALLRVSFRAPSAVGRSVVKMTTTDLGLSPAPAKTDVDLITFSVTN